MEVFMANWEDIKASVSRATNKTIKKAGELADTASLHFKLKTLKVNQSEKFEKLGKLTYKQLKTDNSYAEAISELIAEIDALREEIKALKKEIEQFKAKEASGAVDQMLSSAKAIGAVKVITAKMNGADAGKLRQTGDVLRDKDASVVAVLASVNGDKVSFLAVCGKDAVKAGIKAGEIVKMVCTMCGGDFLYSICEERVVRTAEDYGVGTGFKKWDETILDYRLSFRS